MTAMVQLIASIVLMYAVVFGAGWFMLKRPGAAATRPTTEDNFVGTTGTERT